MAHMSFRNTESPGEDAARPWRAIIDKRLIDAAPLPAAMVFRAADNPPHARALASISRSALVCYFRERIPCIFSHTILAKLDELLDGYSWPLCKDAYH